MDYESEYRRYKQLYLELKTMSGGGSNRRVEQSDTDSTEIDSEYRKLIRVQKQLLGESDDLKRPKMKQLKKIAKTLDQKGRVFVFFDGRPIIAAQTEREATDKLIRAVFKKPDRYHERTAVMVNISYDSQYLLNKIRGPLSMYLTVHRLRFMGDSVRIHPRDQRNSSIRIFYNVDEIERFKLSKLASIAQAAEERKFKDTVIGHYQYTEVEDILKK